MGIFSPLSIVFRLPHLIDPFLILISFLRPIKLHSSVNTRKAWTPKLLTLPSAHSDRQRQNPHNNSSARERELQDKKGDRSNNTRLLQHTIKKRKIIPLLEKFMAVVMWGVAFVVGILVGWLWKPRWASLNGDCASSGLTVVSRSLPVSTDPCPSVPEISSRSSGEGETGKKPESEPSRVVMEDDLLHLSRLVEEKDGGPAWIRMMDKTMPSMTYQAWRRDPESGPPQYQTRTVFEDATPETVRDFFWDDDFRLRCKWDDMLIHSSILEECSNTGEMVVQWLRKFPFFCSNREYVIGRRIWQSGRSYYCVTKGSPCSSLPRKDKPRRVDLFYSSWCIRPVESNRGDGQLTACEVLLFHHEDMGIPWEIAKLGVRQGMWGAVKKIEPGLRTYQKERASSLGTPISRYAFLAQINTKVSDNYLASIECSDIIPSKLEKEDFPTQKDKGFGIPKFLVIGGAIALACTIDRGLLSKALLFGAAKRFANSGKR